MSALEARGIERLFEQHGRVPFGGQQRYRLGVGLGGEIAGDTQPPALRWAGTFRDRDGSGFASFSIGRIWGLCIMATSRRVLLDSKSSSYGRVGYCTYKIAGSGAGSFVQNHPFDPSSVIVYAAPEGDEVATYTRGTARLVEARRRYRWARHSSGSRTPTSD